MHPFTYTKANTATEAIVAVAAGGPGTRYLAGGTTLYDLMKLNVETPTHVVDVTGLSGMSEINTSGDRELAFGALARMSDVARDPKIVNEYPLLSESLWRAASEQLRNMATVGGNLLQRTRCAYFRFGEPFACNKRNPGSGCAAQEGIDRGHAVLGGSTSCIAWTWVPSLFHGSLDSSCSRMDLSCDSAALRAVRRSTGFPASAFSSNATSLSSCSR